MKKLIFFLIASFASSLAVGAIPEIVQRIGQQRLIDGFSPYTIDLDEVFSDPDGHALTYQAEIAWDEVIAITIEGNQMTISPNAGLGVAKVTLTASDPNLVSIQFSFIVQVTQSDNQDPVLDSAILNVTAFYSIIEGDPSFYREVDVSNNFIDSDGDDMAFVAEEITGSISTSNLNDVIIVYGDFGGGIYDIFKI